MSAVLLPFTSPRSVYPSRDLGSCVVVRVQSGGAGASIIHPERPARITITARHPKTIVVVGRNDNRFIISQALAGEERADYCCNLSSLFTAGASTVISEFVRALVPGNLSALLNSSQEPSRRVSKCFELLLNVLRHGNHHGRRSFVSVQKVFGEVTNV